jgi:hypothetical protein
MHMNRLGFVYLPALGPEDAGGAGGGGNAPIGADPAGGGGASTPAANEPTVYDMDENALIRVKGSDKPVKFGEHVRGFQSQFTKASQQAAQLKKELEQERTQRTRYEQELQRARQGGQGGGEDVYAQLRQLPYLTGEHAVEVVQSIGQQLQQRDRIMAAIVNKLQMVEKGYGSLHQTNSAAQFESKINKFVDDAGLGKDYLDFAKELYVAYEGDDLDQEFPRILSERVEALRKAFTGERERKVAAARQAPFVPGRGATTGPSKPLEIAPNAKPSEIADLLWRQSSGNDT